MSVNIGFFLEGIEELEAELLTSRDYMGQDLQTCVLMAGDAAVAAMQGMHPYQDRTYRLSGGGKCRPFGRQTLNQSMAIVEWDAPYAAAVNYGVPGKSRPYPFVPIGKLAAYLKLERCMDDALEKFCRGR